MRYFFHFEKNRFLVCVVLILTLPPFLCNMQAQNQAEKVILNYTDLKIIDILDSLSNKFAVNFSYNSDLPYLQNTKTISCYAGLEDILKILLDNSDVDFSISGNHIILFHVDVAPKNESVLYVKEKFIVLRGRIVDSANEEPLSFASISVAGKSIGTVANDNGDFIIKLSESIINDSLVFSYNGYQAEYMKIADIKEKQLLIKLKEIILNINPVIVKNISALDIVEEMTNKVVDNYSDENVMCTAYYRETTTENDRLLSICEAVLDVAKSPYRSQLKDDQARIFKGRKNSNVDRKAKLKYKFEGGVYNCLRLDIVKDIASFLSYESFNQYEYKYVRKVSNNNREMYVIEFDQKEDVDLPLYKGTLYIDDQSKALVSARFSISPRGIKYARNSLIKKTPRKYQVRPLSADYQVNYKFYNGKWYLDYVRGELRVKAKSDRFLFNSTFNSVAELVITEIDTTNKRRFRWNEIAKPNDAMTDYVPDNDIDFWNQYNIIQPEQPLSEAIKKLSINKDETMKKP
jgi:hypothetical protein